MTDFLLELRCEEIPARMQIKASEDLARLFTEELAKAGLAPQAIESFVTPRRLALIARGLPLRTQAVSEERKGPRANAPEQALAGFLRSTGLTRAQLVDRDGILFAVVEKPGRATADVIALAVPAIVRAFPWPKSMRWGTASQTTTSLRWVRPLQGIVAIFGEDLVPLEIDGIQSSYTTLGHRFHHPDLITIGGANDYVEKLRACHVIASHEERQAIIAQKAQAAAAARGLTLVEDKGLIAENAGLTEWPVPLLGDFDPEFLEVPPEVIQLTLRTNQKYFVLRNPPRHGEGDHAQHGGGGPRHAATLAPAFLCTANIDAHDGGAPTPASSGSRTRRPALWTMQRSWSASLSTRNSAPSPTRSSASRNWRDGWWRRGLSSPARGGGPLAQRVVEGGCRLARPLQILCRMPTPSTTLRAVPLPVPGRNWQTSPNRRPACARPISSPKWSANSPSFRA